MADFHGRFVWYELMTTDPDAAESFYTQVVGWTAQDAGLGDTNYTMLSAGERGVAGLMELPAEARDAGARPGWIGYIGVTDVDAAVIRLKEAGGTVHKPADDIPAIGRFAVVADPQGANFVLFEPFMEGPGERPAPGTAGHTGWHELYATDWEAAFAFYSSQFGWTKADAMDMGPMGTYQLFATGGEPVGGMMNKPDAMPNPAWLYYFNVDGIDAAVTRVTDNGGQIVNGPMEVPGGSWIVQATDPQGALFALVAPQR